MIKLNKICYSTVGRLSGIFGVYPLANYSAATKAKPTQKQILLKVRKDTGFPLMKCKQALVKTNYDVEKAIESLNQDAAKEGWEKMKTLSGRKAKQGLLTAYKVDDHAVLLEVNCESDFVAKTSDFQSFVALAAKTVLEHYAPSNVEQLILQPDEILKLPVSSKSMNIDDSLAKLIGKLKENVHISRGVLTSVNSRENEFIGIYTHPDLGTPRKGGKLPLMGRFAAVVGMKSMQTEPQGPAWLQGMARNLAQHVVGMNPTSIGMRVSDTGSPAGMPPDVSKSHGDSFDELEEEFQSYAFSDELLKQSFLLDENITVQNWLDINQFEVKYFVRYQLGGENHQGK